MHEASGSGGGDLQSTGLSYSQIAGVRDGDRHVGDGFALAIAMHWGITYPELVRLALEYHGEAYVPPPAATQVQDMHPQLTATLAYCRSKLYPASFVQEYGIEARKLPHDRPREVWLADMRVKYWEWKQRRKSEQTRRRGVDPSAAAAADTSSCSGTAPAELTDPDGQSVRSDDTSGVRAKKGTGRAVRDRTAK